ncbi:MAG: NTP transferase domain-containing protein [Gammaproteobacteria bacterium]|nr:molybdenum cofactor guanylyltransferase [Actinomycetota bacterium]NIU78853.1 NTP transferase domain-containing protein [Gammaproteobacteria bacterium]
MLAGGKSARFGANKARARLAGAPLAARSREALSRVATRVVLVSGDTELARELDLDDRPDRLPGQGPLGGLATALHWAREEALTGVLVLACDLPLVPSRLLARLLDRWDGRQAVVPQSRGPLGLEPLCGAYPVTCLNDVEASLQSEVRSMGAFVQRIQPVVLPIASFADLGQPEDLFLNVNRPEDLERVRSKVAESQGSGHA